MTDASMSEGFSTIGLSVIEPTVRITPPAMIMAQRFHRSPRPRPKNRTLRAGYPQKKVSFTGRLDLSSSVTLDSMLYMFIVRNIILETISLWLDSSNLS